MTKPISTRRRIALATAAFAALGSCQSDRQRQAQVSTTAPIEGGKRYAVELWEESLAGGMGSHAAIVLRDRQQAQVLILQGLATDRSSYEVRPMGRADKDDIYAYAGVIGADDLPFSGNERHRRATLLATDNGTDIVVRLAAMLQAAAAVNRQHYAYELFSSSVLAGRQAYNSNATATTLLRAAGLQADKVTFKGYAPGWGQAIPSRNRSDLQRLHARFSHAPQKRVVQAIQRLAGQASVHGALERPKDGIDQYMADQAGSRVQDFVTAMDYNGEQARRARQVAGYQTLPVCRRDPIPDWPSMDTPRAPDGTLLYAENKIGTYEIAEVKRSTAGVSYQAINEYDVVKNPASEKACRTDRMVMPRSTIDAMVKAEQQAKRAYRLPRVNGRVRIDL